MKTTELLNQINFAGQIVNNSAVPIVENLYFNNGQIIATDLKTFIKVKTGIPGNFLVNYKELKKILSKIPKNSEVELIHNDLKVILKVVGTSNTFKIDASQEPNDFPIVKMDNTAILGNLESKDLKCISNYLEFTYNDKYFKKPMDNVYVNGEICATDGHRMLWEKTTGNVSEPILVPKKVAKLCSSLNSIEVIKTIENNEDNTWYSFKNNKHEVIFKKPEGTFPDYKSVIPQFSSLIFNVNRRALIESLNYADISANQTSHRIQLSIPSDNNNLTVFSENLDYNSEYSGLLPIEIKENNKTETFDIGFNNVFLLGILNNLDTELVTFGMTKSNWGVLINDNALLMPVMLDEYSV